MTAGWTLGALGFEDSVRRDPSCRDGSISEGPEGRLQVEVVEGKDVEQMNHALKEGRGLGQNRLMASGGWRWFHENFEVAG